MAARTIYPGSRRKLVLAFDLGTTYSGISYSILDPGQIPVVKGVTKFPAQETISGASKIPTVIYYDREGKVQAVGAETQLEETYEKAETNSWVKAEWFKLHLRSKYGCGNNVTERIPPLPLNKTVVEVIADFLRYLLQCARTYIHENHAGGGALWDSVQQEIEYALSHPNGWEGGEQARMRRAAVLAGLVPDTPGGHRRVTFVTEGEASLHFAVGNIGASGASKHADGIVIVDAGGGTIDISTYRRTGGRADGASYEEIAAAQCHFQGSLFVTIHAHVFLSSYLADSPFVDDVDHIVQCFDKSTKHRFRDDRDPQYIKFGTTRDNDPEREIRFGQLKLKGSDVMQFFKPSVDCIVDAVLGIHKAAKHKICDVILVGGFAANDWLYESVQSRLHEADLNVMRPDNHVNKAVSDGAISFYLGHFVCARVSKMAYGVFCDPVFNPDDPEHIKRRDRTYIEPSSSKERLYDNFCVILPKNTQVQESTEFRENFCWRDTDLDSLRSTSEIAIVCYRGDLDPTNLWKDDDPENFTTLCRITPDLSRCRAQMVMKSSRETYYEIHGGIILSFGLTELKTQVAYLDKGDGVERRSPAKIVYDPDDSRDVI